MFETCQPVQTAGPFPLCCVDFPVIHQGLLYQIALPDRKILAALAERLAVQAVSSEQRFFGKLKTPRRTVCLPGCFDWVSLWGPVTPHEDVIGDTLDGDPAGDPLQETLAWMENGACDEKLGTAPLDGSGRLQATVGGRGNWCQAEVEIL